MGRYPSYEIEARPPIAYFGKGPEPTAVVVLEGPDGSREQWRVPLVIPPVCAYCLPAPGSDGCDHDCRWEQPFTSTRESFHVNVIGPHRLRAHLEGSTCAVVGGEARVQGVRPRP